MTRKTWTAKRTQQRGHGAMIAAKAKDLYEKEARERQKVRKGNQPGASPVTLPELNKGDSRDKAGKAVGVSGSLVDRGAKVLEKGTPELAKAVEDGRMSVTTAAKLAFPPAMKRCPESAVCVGRAGLGRPRSRPGAFERNGGADSTLCCQRRLDILRRKADIALGDFNGRQGRSNPSERI